MQALRVAKSKKSLSLLQRDIKSISLTLSGTIFFVGPFKEMRPLEGRMKIELRSGVKPVELNFSISPVRSDDESTRTVNRVSVGKADFRHVVIVMTTNAGAFEMSRASIGFVQADNASDGSEAIKRLFSPEFRNRIDAIIQFAPLDMPVIERVVDKLIVEVEAQLEKKGVSIILDDAARRWLAAKGYDPMMGARPMARLIQEQIKRPLAEELLFGKLASGGTVKIGVSEDGQELTLITLPTETPALPATLQ